MNIVKPVKYIILHHSRKSFDNTIGCNKTLVNTSLMCTSSLRVSSIVSPWSLWQVTAYIFLPFIVSSNLIYHEVCFFGLRTKNVCINPYLKPELIPRSMSSWFQTKNPSLSIECYPQQNVFNDNQRSLINRIFQSSIKLKNNLLWHSMILTSTNDIKETTLNYPALMMQKLWILSACQNYFITLWCPSQ